MNIPETIIPTIDYSIVIPVYYNEGELTHTFTQVKEKVKLPNIRILVPTLVLWGMKDTAFVPQVLDGLDNYVENLKLVKFDDADHWLHHQLPLELTKQMNRFLAN